MDRLSVALSSNIQHIIHDAVIYDSSSTWDKMVWGLSSNEVSTNSSAYTHIASHTHSRYRPQPNLNFKAIWRANIPNKLKYFLWILCHHRIKTNQRFHALGMLDSPNYSICGAHIEDISHLFFQCHIAKRFCQDVMP